MSIAIVTLRDALVEQVHTQVLLLSVKDQHCHIYMQYALLVNYKMCIVHSIWPHNQPKTYLSLTNLISKQVTHSSILACHCVLLLIIVQLLEGKVTQNNRTTPWGKSQIRNTLSLPFIWILVLLWWETWFQNQSKEIANTQTLICLVRHLYINH